MLTANPVEHAVLGMGRFAPAGLAGQRPALSARGKPRKGGAGVAADGGVSLYGTVSAFGAAPQVLACWLGAASAVAYAVLRMPLAAGTRYLAQARAFALPGSWVPLTLMLGIFVLKYSVGILSAMHAPLVHAALFGPLLGLLYGAFNGVFLGRAARLVLLARRS